MTNIDTLLYYTPSSIPEQDKHPVAQIVDVISQYNLLVHKGNRSLYPYMYAARVNDILDKYNERYNDLLNHKGHEWVSALHIPHRTLITNAIIVRGVFDPWVTKSHKVNSYSLKHWVEHLIGYNTQNTFNGIMHIAGFAHTERPIHSVDKHTHADWYFGVSRTVKDAHVKAGISTNDKYRINTGDYSTKLLERHLSEPMDSPCWLVFDKVYNIVKGLVPYNDTADITKVICDKFTFDADFILYDDIDAYPVGSPNWYKAQG